MNQNMNYNVGITDNKNTNVSNSTSNNTNMNIQTGDMTNRNINQTTATTNNVNVNQSSSYSNAYSNSDQKVISDNTNKNINETNITQRVIQPPPTAIAPAMMSGGGQDLCTTGSSGAVQTQIVGMSLGGTQRDLNCERLKLSKTLFDMGMKVAAVATMCQDRRVFEAMMAAGTPCPYEGQIGERARELWAANPDKIPQYDYRTETEVPKAHKQAGWFR
jgi:hypothetical protein